MVEREREREGEDLYFVGDKERFCSGEAMKEVGRSGIWLKTKWYLKKRLLKDVVFFLPGQVPIQVQLVTEIYVILFMSQTQIIF